MKKQRLLKTLLVAVGLGMGASASGQIVTWAQDSKATYTAGMELSSNTNVVSVKLGSGTWTYDGTWGVCETGVGNNKKPTLSNNVPTAGNYIVIKPTKDIAFTLNTRSSTNHNFNVYEASAPTTAVFTQRARYYVDYQIGTLTKPLEAGKTYYAYSEGSANLGYRGFTATSVEDYTIHYVDDSATPVTIKSDVVYQGLFGATVTASESDMENIVYAGNTYAYQSGNTSITLGTSGKDITLIFAKATAASVKVRYMANIAGVNTSIKSDETIESAVGATVSATGEKIPTYITYNEVKYKYSSGNNPLTVSGVEEDDVITLVYTTAPVFAYEVNAYDGSDNKLATITSGSYVEGDEAITVAYPQYVLSGTTLYNIANNGSGDYYRRSFTPDADNYEYKLVYNGSSVSDVVYYTEVEKLSSVTSINYTNRASNGQVAHTGGADTYVSSTTLDAGVYKIYMRSINGSSNAANALNVNFKAGSKIIYSVSIGQGTNVTNNSDNIIIASDATAIEIAVKGHGTGGVDWFYIVKTGDLPTTETVEVSAAGMATYVPAYNLDFSATTLKAYKAKVTTKGVCTLTAVDEVPAGTPVLLIGATESVPVIANAAAVTENDLVAGTGTAVATNETIEEVDYTNMILNNVGGNVGFYFAAGQTVAANRAYLHIASTLAPAAAGARMSMVFDGESTGINAVQGEGLKVNGSETVYNLNGQRVAQPTKGLYIVGGKKVIVK